MLKRILIFLFMVGFFVTAGIYFLTQATEVKAADSEPGPILDCLSCHEQTLEYHDALGAENSACWTCHDPADMSKLRLSSGTQLPLWESNELCGQCHQVRYDTWQKGTHGFSGTVAAGKCVNCHDPHQPQISLLGITKPPHEPTPVTSGLPSDPVVIAIISMVFLIGLGVIVARRGI